MRRRGFEPCTFRTFYIGVPACIRKHRLAVMPHIQMQQVCMTVTAAKTAAVQMDIGVVHAPAGTQDVVPAGIQCLRRLCRAAFGQCIQLCPGICTKIPERFFTQCPFGSSGQFRVCKQQRPLCQQVACVDAVTVALRQNFPVRRDPDSQCTEHPVDGLFQRRRHLDAVAAGQQQGVRCRMQHLAVVHGALLPLHTVREDGVAQVFRQPFQREGLPVFSVQPQTDQKQSVGLNGTPVAQPVEGLVLPHQKGTVFGKAFVHSLQQGRRQGITEQFRGAQPVFRPETGFQCTPCGAFALRCVGHTVKPVGQQFHKRSPEPLLAGEAPRLCKIEQDGVAVQRIGPFRVAEGNSIPLHRTGKPDRLVGRLHLPVVTEQKFPAADLLCPCERIAGRGRALLLDLCRHGCGILCPKL